MKSPFNFKYYKGLFLETIFIMVVMWLIFSLFMWDINILMWYKSFFGCLMYAVMIGVLVFIFSNYILGNDED